MGMTCGPMFQLDAVRALQLLFHDLKVSFVIRLID